MPTKHETVQKIALIVKVFLLIYGTTLRAETLSLSTGEIKTIAVSGLLKYQLKGLGIAKITQSKEAPLSTLMVEGIKDGKSVLILSFQNHQRKRITIHVGGGQRSKKVGHEKQKQGLRPSRELRNQIIGDIYYTLLQEYVEDVLCWEAPSFNNHFLICSFNERTAPSVKVLQQLKQRYPVVEFRGWQNESNKPQNYRLRMKVMQMERSDGAEFSLGLHQISTNLETFLKQDTKSWLMQQDIILKEHSLKLTTLAEPEALVSLNTKIKLQMGQEVMFPKERESSGHTETIMGHYFAGLRVELILHDHGEHLRLVYQTELTSTAGQSVQGNKEASALFLREGEIAELFELSLQSESDDEKHLPLLYSLPLIGDYFKSTVKQKAYKKIYGLLVVENAQRKQNDQLSSPITFSTSPTSSNTP